MKHEDAAQRVRRRITEWIHLQGHGSRKQLADAVKGLYGASRSSSWVTDITDGPEHGGQDLRLRDLDAIASAMGTTPGDLVRHAEHGYLEVNSTEQRIIRFFRAMPDVARHHVVAYFDYLYNLQQQSMDAQTKERDRRTAEARRLRASQQRHERKRPGA